MQRLETTIPLQLETFKITGLVRDLNPGPRAPEARIIPLDQRALDGATFEANQDRYGASLAQW